MIPRHVSSGFPNDSSAEGSIDDCNVDLNCHVDVNCLSVNSLARDSVGQMSYVDGGSFVCSGALLNTTSGEPWFLTAAHCINTDAVAETLDIDWFFQPTKLVQRLDRFIHEHGRLFTRGDKR